MTEPRVLTEQDYERMDDEWAERYLDPLGRYHPALLQWMKSVEHIETPFLNHLKKSPLREQRPILGYTEDRRRFVHHIYRIGERLHRRVARLVPVEVCDEDGDCTQYYERNQWRWLNTAAARSRAMAPKPIYDMEWVDPNPPLTNMEWGFKDGADIRGRSDSVTGETVGNGGVLGAEIAGRDQDDRDDGAPVGVESDGR